METGTALTIAGTIATALVTTIGHLWRAFRIEQKATADAIRESEAKMAEKLDKCEDKHDEANKAIVELAVKVGEARGYDEATRAIEERFDKFHRDMLDELRNDP